MAACGDCRAAHAVPVRGRRETSSAAR